MEKGLKIFTKKHLNIFACTCILAINIGLMLELALGFELVEVRDLLFAEIISITILSGLVLIISKLLGQQGIQKIDSFIYEMLMNLQQRMNKTLRG